MKPQYYDPFWLIVEPTNRCNFRCVHCFRENNCATQRDMSVDLYARVLREATAYHPQYLSLTGGEATLHPEFERLLEIAGQYNYQTIIVTNGWTFDRVHPAIGRHKAHLSHVGLSLDAADATTHDAIRQVRGSYDRVMQACLICRYYDVNVRLNMTIHRRNIAHIDDVVRLAETLGVDKLYLGVAQLTRQLEADGLALSPSERCTLEEQLWEVRERASERVEIFFDSRIPNPCFSCRPMQMTSVMIDYQGRVRFCGLLPRTGDDHESGLPDVVGSLAEESLYALHRKLGHMIADVQASKIQRVEDGTFTELDHFPCYYCAQYFDKLTWLNACPDSAWTA